MNESRTSNSIRNITASVVYQILNFILSFLSRTVFIQVLGVGYLGINGLFNDVLSMLNLAELGFGTAMTYSMYKPLAENDYETLAGLTHFYKKVYRLIALSIAIIGISIIPFLPYLINLEQDIPNLEIYYVLFLASNVASYLVTYKTTVMYADQKNYVFLRYSSYWSIAQTIVLTSVLFITKSYILYLAFQVAFVYASNLQKSFVAQRRYPFIGKKIKLSKEKTKGIFSDLGSAFLYKIANVMITATDNTLISVIVSTEMVGYYSNYQIITARIGALVSTFFSSLITSLGNLIVSEDEKRRYEVFQIIQSISFILDSFFATCIFILQEDFVRVWLGEDFVLGVLPLLAIVFNFYFSISTMPIVAFREAAGLFRKTKFIMVWTAVLNLLLSVVLGKKIGLAGIIFATSISKLLSSFWYEPVVLFREYFNKPCILYFINMIKSFAFTAITSLLLWRAFSWFRPNSWIQLILKGSLISGISLFLIFSMHRRSAGFELLVTKIKSIVINMKRKT